MARKQIKKSSYYTSGSTALKYNERTLRQKNNKEVKLELLEPKYKEEKKGKLGVFVLYLFLIAVIVVILKAEFTVGVSAREVDQLNRELVSIKAKNEILENKINSAMNLDKIKDTAISEYGMIYPNLDDVLVVDVPNKSYTVVYDDVSSDKAEGKSLQSLVQFIAKGW